MFLEWQKSSGMWQKVWLKVFWGRPSQCIYRMDQDFLTHGILLSMAFIYGIFTLLIFRVFSSFLERVGINHNKCSSSLHLWGRNNNVLDHILWKFSFEGQNGGNNGGNMMYDYGLDHGELGEQIFVLTTTTSRVFFSFFWE